jgi:hypothetical protein
MLLISFDRNNVFTIMDLPISIPFVTTDVKLEHYIEQLSEFLGQYHNMKKCAVINLCYRKSYIKN